MANMSSMGAIRQDWAACFTCMQYELVADRGALEKIASQHRKCSGQLYTSMKIPSDARKLEFTELERLNDGLRLKNLDELPRASRRADHPYIGTMKLGGRRVRIEQAAAIAAKEAMEKYRGERLGKLSPERTKEIVEKYLHFVTSVKGGDCKLWTGPKSIRLYRADGSTEVTRSPLALATFLAFGKGQTADKIFRSCANDKCINHLHLILATTKPSSPQPIEESDLIKQLFESVSRPQLREACLISKHQSTSLTLRGKGSEDKGQRTATLWKPFFYLAFGSLPNDDDRRRVRTTCGYLSCLNPDHLSLKGRQQLPDPQRAVLMSLGQLLDLDRLDPDECTYVTDELVAQALGRFGARNQWGSWSPFHEDSKGVLSLSIPVVVAALSLRFLGWCVLPMHLEQKDVRALRCKQDPACINPLHKQEAILELAKHILYRDWVLMSFKLRPQHFGNARVNP